MARVTPGLLLGLVAVVLAFTTGAVAASKITGRQIARNTVTGKNLKDRTITREDLSPSLRRAMERPGPMGPIGPQGIPGANGGFNLAKVVTRSGALTRIPGGATGTVVLATCNPGERAVSGGFYLGGTAGRGFVWASSVTGDGLGWRVSVDNTGGSDTEGYAVVVCAMP